MADNMKTKKQTGRVISSPQQFADAALRETRNFARNMTYDYPATERYTGIGSLYLPRAEMNTIHIYME